MSVSHNSLVGSRIGRFEVVNEIGSGGMAAVYLARSIGSAGFQRLVAIKVMHPHLSTEDAFVEMFLDEARVAATIHHPNVVPIIDVGMEDELIFLIMDYIEGDSLSSVEKVAVGLRRRIPLGIILRVVLDTLAGLHAAHELCGLDGNHLKIIHRDVSPQNIVIGCDGVSRIVDFGIAKAESRITTTKVGMLKGKLNFMAPEQLKSAAVDRRVDVFGMGVTLWEAVTLRRLYAGETELETAKKILQGDYPRLIDYDSKLPMALDEVCRRALAINLEERYPTAAAFADSIESKLRSNLASSREVGQFIAGVAAVKIENERRAVRDFARESANAANAANALLETQAKSGPRRNKPTINAMAMPGLPQNPAQKIPAAPRVPVVTEHEIYDDDGETALITREPNRPPPMAIHAKAPVVRGTPVGDDTEEIISESRTLLEPRYVPPSVSSAQSPKNPQNLQNEARSRFPVPTTPASLESTEDTPAAAEVRERTMPISLVQRRPNDPFAPEAISAAKPQSPAENPFAQAPQGQAQVQPPQGQSPNQALAQPQGQLYTLPQEVSQAPANSAPLGPAEPQSNTLVYVLLSIALVSFSFATFWWVTHH